MTRFLKLNFLFTNKKYEYIFIIVKDVRNEVQKEFEE